MDVRVGGSFKMSFLNFGTGNSHTFGGEYLELVPHERTDKGVPPFSFFFFKRTPVPFSRNTSRRSPPQRPAQRVEP